MYLSSFLLALCVLLALSIRRSAPGKGSEGFALAGRSLGASGVSWVIIATLVGGASTVGTVEMAFRHGWAAWIFTLGSGLACLLLALAFARPLRESGAITVSEFIGHRLGGRLGLYTALFTSLGMFVHVVAQYLAAAAVLRAVTGVSQSLSLGFACLLAGGLVVGGGLAGSRAVGRVKFFLLYGLLTAGAVLALARSGGWTSLHAAVPGGASFGLASYGWQRTLNDLGAMLVGVVGTQTYLQALFSARDARQARRGALLSAVLIPPLGVMGTLIGLYLRGTHPELATDPAGALPFFLRSEFPAPLAGVGMAGLLLVALGTGAGLALGVTTTLYRDFLGPWLSRRPEPGRCMAELARIRLTAIAVLLLALGMVWFGLDSAILRWSFLSMGLRGAAVFPGLALLAFWPRLARLRWVRILLYLFPPAYLILALVSH